MKKIILLTAFQFILFIAFAQSFNVGDKVEIYNSGGWYKGTILEIGSGNMQGYYSVSYDGYKQAQWMKKENIKLQKATAAKPASDINGPRNATYIILSYGNPKNPIRIGYFKLSSGKYSYYDMSKKLIGQGAYTYNANNSTVQWANGPFKNAAWGGGFGIDREGKTHTIKLNAVTIGTNSTDSDLGF